MPGLSLRAEMSVRELGMVARAAALAAHHDFVHAGQTDEYVDHCFDFHPGAEEHVNDVPVCTTGEPAKTDETPVQGTDRDKDAYQHRDGRLVTHKR